MYLGKTKTSRARILPGALNTLSWKQLVYRASRPWPRNAIVVICQETKRRTKQRKRGGLENLEKRRGCRGGGVRKGKDKSRGPEMSMQKEDGPSEAVFQTRHTGCASAYVALDMPIRIGETHLPVFRQSKSRSSSRQNRRDKYGRKGSRRRPNIAQAVAQPAAGYTRRNSRQLLPSSPCLHETRISRGRPLIPFFLRSLVEWMGSGRSIRTGKRVALRNAGTQYGPFHGLFSYRVCFCCSNITCIGFSSRTQFWRCCWFFKNWVSMVQMAMWVVLDRCRDMENHF
jgi:hypothetical protein